MGLRRDAMEALERCAFAAELLGEKSARYWTGAAWSFRQLDGDIGELLASGELQKAAGLGPKALAVVTEVASGRTPEALLELKDRLPEGLFEIRRIRGLGPKKVASLWKDLGITTLGELEYACRENRLVDLKGFGKKTQESIVAQIPALREERGRMRRDEAATLCERARVELLGRGASEVLVAGDLRLGAELVETNAVLAVAEGELALTGLDERLVVVVVNAAHRGAGLLRATGPKEHVAMLEARASERGTTLEAIEGATEEDVLAVLGLPVTDPELRGDVVPATPSARLVRRSDLRGALHNHTDASDGSNTLDEMRAAASAWGLTYFGISEHSVSAFYAQGLDAARLEAQLAAIARLNEKPGCVLLTGVESDILEDGALDYPDALFEKLGLDVVVASVHKRYAHDRAAATARMTRAARSPWTTLLGHPTGRLLLGRPPMDYEIEALLSACKESGCAIELNANPQRLDLSARHAAMAKEQGVLVSIAADAHHVNELDNLEHGLSVARRAGLRPQDVLNCMELPELRAWLSARRERARA